MYIPGKCGRARGFSSVISIIFVVLFSVLAISFTSLCDQNVQIAQNHQEMAQARAAAESGVEYSNWLIGRYLVEVAPHTYHKDLSVAEMEGIFNDLFLDIKTRLETTGLLTAGSMTQINGFVEGGSSGSEFLIPALNLGGAGQATFALRFRMYAGAPETVEVYSEGQIGTILRQVCLSFSIVRQLPGLFEYALFAKDTLSLNAGVNVTGYNFLPGDDPLKIGTQSTNAGAVALNASVTVDGDVEVGVGGDPATVVYLGNGASYSGSSYAMPELWEPPAVQVPAGLAGATSQGTITTSLALSSGGKYDQISLAKNEVLRIEGPVELYVSGDIVLGQGASIEISDAHPDASLTLYLGGNLLGERYATLNNRTGDSKMLTILGLDTCQSFTLDESGTVTASLYIPNAVTTFNHAVELYEAAISQNFDQNHAASVYYDAALCQVDYDGVDAPIILVADGNSYVEML